MKRKIYNIQVKKTLHNTSLFQIYLRALLFILQKTKAFLFWQQILYYSVPLTRDL